MDWELVNGITGLISAICAIVGIGYFGFEKDITPSVEERTSFNMRKLVSFVIACSGWVLCCLSYLWIAEPYGCCMSSSEYQHFYGVVLGFPAVVVFFFGVKLMQGVDRL